MTFIGFFLAEDSLTLFRAKVDFVAGFSRPKMAVEVEAEEEVDVEAELAENPLAAANIV